MKNVVLINPPWYFKRGLTNLSQCLGLGYVAAYLRAHGHQVQVIDALAEGHNVVHRVATPYGTVLRIGLDYTDIVARIPLDADFVGIGGPFNYIAGTVKEVARHIKARYPEKPVVVGGPYPSSLPEDALTKDVDYVVVGEGEKPMLQLVEGVPPKRILGLAFRRDGSVVTTGRSPGVANLDDIPFVARDILPLETYLRISPRGWRDLPTLSIITSRGCPYDCHFCSIHAVCGRQWRARSPDNVLQEVEECVIGYGVKHIEFEDDNLTIDSERAIAIFRGIQELGRRLGRQIAWSASNGFRIDTLDEEVLTEMKRTGCTSMILALEHGDPAILQAMNKRLDLAKVEEVAHLCGKLELPTHMFLMVGYPGETRESFERSMDYAQHLKNLGNVRRFWVFTTKPVSGTQLARFCLDKGFLAHPLIPEAEVAFLDEDYGGIVTPDFDLAEVRRRRRYAEAKLNPYAYSLGLKLRQIVMDWVPGPGMRLLQSFQRRLGW